MKFYLKIIVILLLNTKFVYASENFLLKKFHKLNINSQTIEKPFKLGVIRGNVDSYPYGFDYYASVKDGKVLQMIETFYFDNFGDHMSRFNNWARAVVYLANPNDGCNNSQSNFYHSVTDNGPAHFNCFTSKMISTNEGIWGPNFNNNQHIPMGQRKVTLRRAIKKFKLDLPNEMFRSEHYFYRAGKLTWVFYSVNKDLFLDDEEKFFKKSVEIHENFEKDLKYKNYMKINFE